MSLLPLAIVADSLELFDQWRETRNRIQFVYLADENTLVGCSPCPRYWYKLPGSAMPMPEMWSMLEGRGIKRWVAAVHEDRCNTVRFANLRRPKKGANGKNLGVAPVGRDRILCSCGAKRDHREDWG